MGWGPDPPIRTRVLLAGESLAPVAVHQLPPSSSVFLPRAGERGDEARCHPPIRTADDHLKIPGDGDTWFERVSPSRGRPCMATPAEFLVSTSGQMSVPAAVRHRWGSITVGE